MKECVWVRPEVVTQIEFLEWTGADHLRHTKFIALRDDTQPRRIGLICSIKAQWEADAKDSRPAAATLSMISPRTDNLGSWVVDNPRTDPGSISLVALHLFTESFVSKHVQ
jgi:ATP dependent DNA ligase C terminal region